MPQPRHHRENSVSKAKKNKRAPNDDPQSRIVARNRRARHEYEIQETLECGIVLQGSEVKSIRDNKITIEEAYARIQNGELYLLNCDIAEYPQANVMNHERRRPRKLLLKKKELRKFAEVASQQGQTLIPLEVRFRRGLVKVVIAAARGRQLHDKREKLKKAAAGRSIREAMKTRR